jgi:cytochrome c-type biogenesis protein CcmH/NrfG
MNTALFFLRGTALLQAGDPVPAIADFKRGLEIEPANQTLRQLLEQATALRDRKAASAPETSASGASASHKAVDDTAGR